MQMRDYRNPSLPLGGRWRGETVTEGACETLSNIIISLRILPQSQMRQLPPGGSLGYVRIVREIFLEWYRLFTPP